MYMTMKTLIWLQIDLANPHWSITSNVRFFFLLFFCIYEATQGQVSEWSINDENSRTEISVRWFGSEDLTKSKLFELLH
jgi:hypothetical protein